MEELFLSFIVHSFTMYRHIASAYMWRGENKNSMHLWNLGFELYILSVPVLFPRRVILKCCYTFSVLHILLHVSTDNVTFKWKRAGYIETFYKMTSCDQFFPV